MEPLPVISGRRFNDPGEDLAERAGVKVANIQDNAVNGLQIELQSRLLHACLLVLSHDEYLGASHQETTRYHFANNLRPAGHERDAAGK